MSAGAVLHKRKQMKEDRLASVRSSEARTKQSQAPWSEDDKSLLKELDTSATEVKSAGNIFLRLKNYWKMNHAKRKGRV